MASPEFLSQGSSFVVNIGSVNIHGFGNKLDSQVFFSWLIKHDIVFICELKRVICDIPGYKVIISRTENVERGGSALLVKNYLAPLLVDVDLSELDQIWFKLLIAPNVLFGACYIPPADSPYYHDSSFAFAHAKCLHATEKTKVMFGDINSRLGQHVSQLVYNDPRFSYSPGDNVPALLPHGKKSIAICKDCDMLVLNNLKSGDTVYPGGLSFRKKNRWISELDICMISRNDTHLIKSFNVDQRLDFPSDHAPISFSLDCVVPPPSVDDLCSRADDLGVHVALPPDPSLPHLAANAVKTSKPPDMTPAHDIRKPIRHHMVDEATFISALDENICDTVLACNSVEGAVQAVSNSMYKAALHSKSVPPQHMMNSHTGPSNQRLKRILESNDDKALWRAINWKGEVTNGGDDAHPTDRAFQEHLEEVLNPPEATALDPAEFVTAVQIPLLDDPIDPSEVDDVLRKQLKSDKSPGLDGLGPGLFKLLPAQWIIAITFILNIVFYSSYPVAWAFNKLRMVFKKGDRESCDNYRGISVLTAFAKIYDYILYNRLIRWFIPCREQAGALPSRSCIEHIMSLRFLLTYAKLKKLKLFVLFVDFSKAYDRINRCLMLKILIRLGCSAIMVLAILEMYKMTRIILGGSVITATAGVRQGSPTSCFLFILFVDILIRLIREGCVRDGFLGWLHIMMLMDDTVILATTREGLVYKMSILAKYCDDHGMLVNFDKTKFMAINGSAEDKLPIPFLGDFVIHCWRYVYLGAVFTSDGNLSSSLTEHVKDKRKHLHKFIMFLRSNPDMPFVAKRKVLVAAFNSAILFGCESWIGASPQVVNVLYMSAIKSLLGVRTSTPNDLCLAEVGLPPLESFVKDRQSKFLRKAIAERHDIQNDDPLMFSMYLARNLARISRIINDLLSLENYTDLGVQLLHDRIRAHQGSRYTTYVEINPSLSVHDVYSRRRDTVPEHTRVSFSRMRLSSHRLKVETGRWARGGAQTLRENRVCTCGVVQDERHILTGCPRTEHLRQIYDSDVLYPDILASASSLCDFKFIYEVLKVYDE